MGCRHTSAVPGAGIPAPNPQESGVACDAESQLIGLGRRYFTQLDRLTHPGMTVLESDVLRLIQQLLDVLKRRVLFRRHTIYADGCEMPGADICGIRRISALILDLLESTYGWSNDSSRALEAIGLTHDMFSWGQLESRKFPGVRVPNNVPDGAPIFFFAEFGHLALDHGVDAGRWMQVLPIFTRMPALYVKIFELNRALLPQPFDEFGRPTGYMKFKEELSTYARMLRMNLSRLRKAELGALLGILARRAFSD